MAAVVAIVAGAYTSTYTPPSGSALALGVMAENGWELSCSVKQEEINQTDRYGLTLLETIFRGADWRARCVGKEYSANLLKAFWPWSANANALQAELGIIARRGSEVAGSLILTSTTGTPAAASPATLTAAQALISPNANLSLAFTSRAREVPLEMVFLPYIADSKVIWFSLT